MPSKMIKWKDKVTPNLLKLDGNIRVAMETGVIESMSVSTKAMKRRVETATTKTGKRRVAGLPPLGAVRPAWYLGRGPGRIESGRMINSIRWQSRTSQGGVLGTAGFINAPRYTALQELGGRKVPPMLAFARGHTVFTARFAPTMEKYLRSAVRNAELGKSIQNKAL